RARHAAPCKLRLTPGETLHPAKQLRRGCQPSPTLIQPQNSSGGFGGDHLPRATPGSLALLLGHFESLGADLQVKGELVVDLGEAALRLRHDDTLERQ